MLRILSVLLFCAGVFCLAQSHAQVPMTGAGLGATAVVASYTGPGDISGSTTVFGFLTRPFTGAIASGGTTVGVNVTRTSDSMTCDIYVANTTTGFGNVHTTGGCTASGTGAAFCNATTCQVNTWYSQGSSNNATLQTAAGTVTLIIGTPSYLNFGPAGTTGTFYVNYSAQAQPFTCSAATKRTDATNGNLVFMEDENNVYPYIQYDSSSTPNMQIVDSNAVTVAAAARNSWHTLQVLLNSVSSSARLDGTTHSIATLVPGTDGMSGQTGIQSYNTSLTIYIGEIICWAGDQSTHFNAVETNQISGSGNWAGGY
jgi:hypothetical protein